MVIVERAMLAPACCMFTKTAEGPFIDLLREFDLDHAGRMYITTRYARELGAFAGLPSTDDLEAALEKVARLERENAELTDEVESLREFEQSARYTVETLGDRIRRKPGPKAKVT